MINDWPVPMEILELPEDNDPHKEVTLIIKKYKTIVRAELGHLENGKIKYVEL